MAKEVLIEIKKGQVGRGLLIENDGFISLDHPNNKKLRENIEEFKGRGSVERKQRCPHIAEALSRAAWVRAFCSPQRP